MADWTTLATTDAYATLLARINDRDTDLARGLDPAVVTVTNPPNLAIRWSTSAGKWQRFTDSSWVDLAAVYNINVAGTVTAPAGTVSAPSIAFSGGASTGWYAPATDRIALSIAGTQRLYVSGVGRFSFGAGTSPVAQVTVAGGGFAVQETGVNRNLSFTDSSGTVYGTFGYNSAAGALDAYVSNAQTGGRVILKIAGTDRVILTETNCTYLVNLTMDSGKQIIVPDGSATAPSIAHSEGANDTGIYFGGDGNMYFATNGLKRTTLDEYGVFINEGLIKGNGGGLGLGKITVSTSSPSGGASGDLWLKY